VVVVRRPSHPPPPAPPPAEEGSHFQGSRSCPSAYGHPETMKIGRQWTDVVRAGRPPHNFQSSRSCPSADGHPETMKIRSNKNGTTNGSWRRRLGKEPRWVKAGLSLALGARKAVWLGRRHEPETDAAQASSQSRLLLSFRRPPSAFHREERVWKGSRRWMWFTGVAPVWTCTSRRWSARFAA
jgi:hypothetical protein